MKKLIKSLRKGTKLNSYSLKTKPKLNTNVMRMSKMFRKIINEKLKNLNVNLQILYEINDICIKSCKTNMKTSSSVKMTGHTSIMSKKKLT